MEQKRGFGQLFGDSIKEFADKFVMILKSFLAFYFIPAIVFILLAVMMMIVTYPSISGNAISGMAVSGLTGDFILSGQDLPFSATFVIILIVVMSIILGLLHVLLNLSFTKIAFFQKEKSFSEIFDSSKPYFWRYLGLSLLFFIFVGLLSLLLIIPGIIFGVFWIFSSIILVGENKGVWESFKESKRIVKGRWWRVFGYILLFGLIAFFASLVLGLVPIVGQVVPTLFIVPLSIIFLKNFYSDLKRYR